MTRLPRIAIVDGDSASRDRLAEVLRSLGWAVQTFGTISSATYALVPEPPDLMIVSVHLPDGLGLNLMDVVRRRTGEKVTTIAMSEVADEQEVVRCFTAGAVDFAAKPFHEHELVARCRVHLAKAAGPEPISPDTPDVPTLEGLAFGRYRIVRELGRGGFGIVYLAEDNEARRLVALKVSTPPADDHQAQARFVRETYVISKIVSDHVVRLFDTGVLHGRIYYAMEYVPGPSLARRVSERGPMSETDTRTLAKGLLEALAAANAVGIVHRDIKPSNVILRDGEVSRAVLLDFGLAKHLSDRALTRASGEFLLGTPSYMAPEIVRGSAEHGHTSDLWSIGVTLRFALTGEEVWPRLTGMNLLHAVASQEIPPPERLLSSGFARLLGALYAFDRSMRPPSATVALRFLAHVCVTELPATEDTIRHDDKTPKATPVATKITFRTRGTTEVAWDEAIKAMEKQDEAARTQGSQPTPPPKESDGPES